MTRQNPCYILKYQEYFQVLAGIRDAEAMLQESDDPELRDLVQEELTTLRQQIDTFGEELKLLLLPRDPQN